MHFLYSFNSNSLMHIKWLYFSYRSLQQIAFKNLVQRNRQNEQQNQGPPALNSTIQLPFIIINTSRKTVIDCSISSDKWVQNGAGCSRPVFSSRSPVICQNKRGALRAVSFGPVPHHSHSMAPRHVPGPLLPVKCRVVPGPRPGCARMYMHVV